MSGPKTSRYQLTAEQRRILMEQLRRQQRMIEERSRISEACKGLKLLSAEMSTSFEKAALLQSRTGVGTEFLSAVNEFKLFIESETTIASAYSENIDLKELEDKRRTLDIVVSKVHKETVKLKEQAKAIISMLNSDLNKSIDRGFAANFTRIKQKKDLFEDIRQGIQMELEGLLSHYELPQNLRQEILSTLQKVQSIQGKDYISNFKSMIIVPLKNKCHSWIQLWSEFGERFTDLSLRYESLCSMLGIQTEKVEFSPEAISRLEELISSAEEDMLKIEEQTYISGCVDEVMKDMGYDILGRRTVTKRSGKRFRNELYAFEEGTAVNVTYGSDGSIAMELAGIDYIDRLPTSDESRRLCRDMETFCGEFIEIEERLRKYGIIVGHRISLKPPAEEYAQIINTQDFEMEKEASLLNVKREQQINMKEQRIESE